MNIASTSGYKGRDKAIGYTAAKAGVLNPSRSMAIQLAPYNIRVNTISPNMIGSPIGKDTTPRTPSMSSMPLSGTGRARNSIQRLCRYDLLLIDEIGDLTLKPEQSNAFFKLMGERF